MMKSGRDRGPTRGTWTAPGADGASATATTRPRRSRPRRSSARSHLEFANRVRHRAAPGADRSAPERCGVLLGGAPELVPAR